MITIRMASGMSIKKFHKKIIVLFFVYFSFICCSIFLSNKNSIAAEYVLNCMSEDIKIYEDKQRLSAYIENSSVEPRYYNLKYEDNHIIYYLAFFRTKSEFPKIWKMDIDLDKMKRSFTVRKIPDEQINKLFNLYKKAKIPTSKFLAESDLKKNKYSDQIFKLKKELFNKNYINPKDWDGTTIPFGNSGDYILKKNEIEFQAKFTFPCSIKN